MLRTLTMPANELQAAGDDSRPSTLLEGKDPFGGDESNWTTNDDADLCEWWDKIDAMQLRQLEAEERVGNAFDTHPEA